MCPIPHLSLCQNLTYPKCQVNYFCIALPCGMDMKQETQQVAHHVIVLFFVTLVGAHGRRPL